MPGLRIRLASPRRQALVGPDVAWYCGVSQRWMTTATAPHGPAVLRLAQQLLQKTTAFASPPPFNLKILNFKISYLKIVPISYFLMKNWTIRQLQASGPTWRPLLPSDGHESWRDLWSPAWPGLLPVTSVLPWWHLGLGPG